MINVVFSGKGVSFFEEVTNTLLLGFYSFFGPFNRLIFGKQVMKVLIAIEK